MRLACAPFRSSIQDQHPYQAWQLSQFIDMLLVVKDSADENLYVPDLKRVGYRLRIREPEWHGHRMLNGPRRVHQLTCFLIRLPEIERILLFRDWLRGNTADRDLYARTKLALAQREWKYIQNYADAKTRVIEEILQRARATRGIDQATESSSQRY